LTNGLFPIAQLKVPSGIVGLVLCLEPVVATLLSAVVFRNRPEKHAELTWHKWVGVFSAVVGIALVVYPTLGGRTDPLYLLLAILSAIACGLGAVVGQAAKDTGPLTLRVNGQSFFGTLWLFPVMVVAQLYCDKLFVDQNYDPALSSYAAMPAHVWGLIVVLVLFPSLGANFMFYYALDRMGAVACAYGFICPVIALALGIAFQNGWHGLTLGDKLVQCGGVVVVLFGTYHLMHHELFPEKHLRLQDYETPLNSAELDEPQSSADLEYDMPNSVNSSSIN